MNRINVVLVCLLLMINTSIESSIAGFATATLGVSARVPEECLISSQADNTPHEYNSTSQGPNNAMIKMIMECTSGIPYTIRKFETITIEHSSVNKPFNRAAQENATSAVKSRLRLALHFFLDRFFNRSAFVSDSHGVSSSNDSSKNLNDEKKSAQSSSKIIQATSSIQAISTGSKQLYFIRTSTFQSQAWNDATKIVVEY